MTDLNSLSGSVLDWDLSAPLLWSGAACRPVTGSGLPFQAAVSVLLSPGVLGRKHVDLFLQEAGKYALETVMAGHFTESGIQGAVFVHDRFDSEFAHSLKFASWDIDALHVGSLPDPRTPGVILLDMDATCVRCECIDEMAKLAGIGDQVSAVTALAMQGHLEFQESFRRRIALFAGKSAAVMDEVERNLPVMPGFGEMVAKAKACSWRVAIASGGFDRFVGKLQREYGLDYVTANSIEEKDGLFTGRVLGRIVDSRVKADTLLMLREKYGIPVRNSMAVGDGANDLPMISLAGTGVAIHAKPVVQEKAPVAIRFMDLQAVPALLEAALLLTRLLPGS